jgi:hypothetical protein
MTLGSFHSPQSKCVANWNYDGCCASCSVLSDCNACVRTPGCGWSYDKGKCLSGTEEGLCQASQWFQVFQLDSNGAPQTCRSPPGPILGISDRSPPSVLNTPVVSWCRGNGVANFKTYTCTCRPGFWGADCSNECPGGASNPCSGRGVCDQFTGICSCRCGSGGRDCSINGCACSSDVLSSKSRACFIGLFGKCRDPCGVLGSHSNTCSGQDVDFTSGNDNRRARTADGLLSKCVCNSKFWGPQCDKACPGVNQLTGEGEVCNGKGTCDPNTGSCVCAPCFTMDTTGNCVPKPCPTCQNDGTCQCNQQTGEMMCSCPGKLTGPTCETCSCQVFLISLSLCVCVCIAAPGIGAILSLCLCVSALCVSMSLCLSAHG